MSRPKKPISQYSENEREIWEHVIFEGLNMISIFTRLDALEKKVNRMHEAYYQQFPDRLEKDEAFEKQMKELKKRKPESTDE